MADAIDIEAFAEDVQAELESVREKGELISLEQGGEVVAVLLWRRFYSQASLESGPRRVLALEQMPPDAGRMLDHAREKLGWICLRRRGRSVAEILPVDAYDQMLQMLRPDSGRGTSDMGAFWRSLRLPGPQ